MTPPNLGRGASKMCQMFSNLLVNTSQETSLNLDFSKKVILGQMKSYVKDNKGSPHFKSELKLSLWSFCAFSEQSFTPHVHWLVEQHISDIASCFVFNCLVCLSERRIYFHFLFCIRSVTLKKVSAPDQCKNYFSLAVHIRGNFTSLSKFDQIYNKTPIKSSEVNFIKT